MRFLCAIWSREELRFLLPYSYTVIALAFKRSEMGPVRQNPIQRTVRSVHVCVCVCVCVCALHCEQLLHTILYRTDLIIFPLALQTTTIAPMMSI